MGSLQLDGMEIRSIDLKGRGMFTTKCFKKDDVLFEEAPLVSCQFAYNQDFGYKACDHCMRPLETAEQNARRLSELPTIKLPVPDPLTHPEQHTICQCQVVYCSSECQELAAAQYHNALCNQPGTDHAKAVKKLRDLWKRMHYPPESASIMIVLRMYAYIHQAQDKAATLTQFQQFVSDASNPGVCEKLLGKFEKKIDTVRQCLVDCVQSLHLDIPPQLLEPVGLATTLSILALNGQGIGTSSFSRWVDHVDKSGQCTSDVDGIIDALYTRMEETVGTEFLNNEGSGLYAMQSKINHSCEPNMEIIFPHGDHRVGIRALTDVEADQEITISYLDQCELKRSRHSRQKLLREKYLFQCLCHKCEAEAGEPDETSDDDDDDDDDDDHDDDDDDDVSMVGNPRFMM